MSKEYTLNRDAFRAQCKAYQDELKAHRQKHGCTYVLYQGLYGPVLCKRDVSDGRYYCDHHHEHVMEEMQRIAESPAFREMLATLGQYAKDQPLTATGAQINEQNKL